MKQLLALVLACVMLVGISGCKRDQSSVLKDMISETEDLVDILKDVKDEASAKSAAPKIQKIAKNMKALIEEGEKMGDPPKEILEKHKPALTKVNQDVQAELSRIGQLKDNSLALVLSAKEAK